jgi:hypothetical protein
MKSTKLEIWYYNPTPRDIPLAELDMTIKSHKCINLLKYNPNLTLDRVLKSEANGVLKRYVDAGKLIKVDKPIINKDAAPRFTESKEPIYSKTHSIITIDPKEKDFIDQLESDFIEDSPMDDTKQVAINEKFLKKVDLEGFADPLEELVGE